MIKKAIKHMLKLVGFKLVRLNSESEVGWGAAKLPAWIQEPEPIADEVIRSGWLYHALQMANRNYRPLQLAYARTPLGEDHRLKYVLYFLDFREKRVLELGPFEGYHSILLEKMGVRETIAVEGRADNFRKCARVKEKYGLDRTTYVLQDIEALVSGSSSPEFSGPFDIVFCCGLLYHLPDPAKALAWFRLQAPVLFLGTHYVEAADIAQYRSPTFEPHRYSSQGRTYNAMLYREGGARDPLSGLSDHSIWVFEADLLQMLRDAGYSKVSVLGKDLQNQTPHISILAEV